ncbi:Cof-type HAD-IIB family hydrolase [Neobacillus muris]|uniref:Cof-type HAD-IIB family hydrolase n=1 Tax=Neobacillus muris TaxID=2941334 RepID=UPI00203FF89D|nr:Cof-type HAD-IIB family hydrolase [Neobacillus muris]
MKLIALDMDGTTVNSINEVNRENILAIKKAQSMGHIVMVLSGRSPESIHALLQKYDLDCPIGASNGTAVYADGKLLELTSLNPDQVRSVALSLDNERIPYKVYTNMGVYMPKDWKKRLDEVLDSGLIPDEHYENENFERMTRNPVESELALSFNHIEELLNKEGLEIQKFFALILVPEQKHRLISNIESVKDGYISTSSPFNIEVMHMDGNKGNGLKVMADYFDIPLEDTVAIGDENNDIPMFETAGLSIAMGNAKEHIKEMCDLVTLTNDENGVAYAIEHYILKETEKNDRKYMMTNV